MKKNKDGIVKANFVNFDIGRLELTPKLEEALEILDSDCANGCGGTWSVYVSDEDGVEFEAEFMDMPTDMLFFVDGEWTENLPEEEEEEEEEDDDTEYGLVG
jgi:hypothetical protein